MSGGTARAMRRPRSGQRNEVSASETLRNGDGRSVLCSTTFTCNSTHRDTNADTYSYAKKSHNQLCYRMMTLALPYRRVQLPRERGRWRRASRPRFFLCVMHMTEKLVHAKYCRTDPPRVRSCLVFSFLALCEPERKLTWQ